MLMSLPVTRVEVGYTTDDLPVAPPRPTADQEVPIVVLHTTNDIVVPVPVDEHRAYAVAASLESEPFDRPLPQDTLSSVVQSFDIEVFEVQVTDYESEKVYAQMRVAGPRGGDQWFDIHPGDAVAVAQRQNIPCKVAADVADSIGRERAEINRQLTPPTSVE